MSEQTLLPVPLLWVYCFARKHKLCHNLASTCNHHLSELGGNISGRIRKNSHSDSTQIGLSARCMQFTNSETMSGQMSGLMPSGGFDFLRDFDEVAPWSGDLLDAAQTHTSISLSAQHTNLPSTCNGSTNASLPSISAPQQECCKSTAAAERNRRAQKTFRQKQRVRHS